VAEVEERADTPPSAGAEQAAPEAVGESAEADAAPQVELSFEEITRIWPAVIEKLRETSPALAATFDGARPVGIDEEGLEIGFPAELTFNKRKAEAKDKREQMTEALVAVTGTQLSPRYVLLDGEEHPAPAEAGGEDVDHETLVEKLKSEFNAEEVG
jgi:hypothetical protein